MSSIKEQGTYLYVIAVQYPHPDGGTGIAHQVGGWTPEKGATRFDVFLEIHKQLIETYPRAATGAVITFDLQPNKL